MAGFDKNRGVIGICLLLALTTLILFLSATRNGFVNLDDHEYIIENTHVTSGLTWRNIVWAFQFTGYASNWHPLTWVSHALDCQLYGLNPAGHHLTSVLLHVANSVLVLLLFRQMTGSLWRSTFLAALFAWHPLHVESVAWASERKDVLSTLFWLLTTMAYVRYVHESADRSPKRWCFYVLSLVLFALGLMSKPMLVTLPFVLLLLDFWPLRRTSTALPPGEQPALLSLPWLRLGLEKAPFFLLAFFASLITYFTQQHAGAVSSLEEVSLLRRAANAAVAYLLYVWKTVWPIHLAAFYPYPRHQSVLLILLAIVFLLACSGIALLGTKRRPFLFTGWFWFLGTLVPTIGLVQVGSQAMADRYMYVPSIGLFALIVWGLRGFLMAWTAAGRALATAAGIIALAGFIFCTSVQIGYWHDSARLYIHAVEVTRDNYIAYNGLGGALDEENQTEEAFAAYRRCVEINPKYPEGQYNFGTSLLNQGVLDQAVEHLDAALKSNPDYVAARNNLGKALMLQGRLDDAADQFTRAIRSDPHYAQAYYGLGTVLLAQSRPTDAVAPFSKAIELKPDYFDAFGNLGIAFMELGRKTDGIAQLSKAVELRPGDSAAHANLGLALLEADRPADAAAEFSAALQINSTDPRTEYNFARALARQHQTANAITHYRAALKLKPDFLQALDNLAWILATDPDPKLRDGHEAITLAQQAGKIAGDKQPGPVLTLAAAEASAGRFTDAADLARKARDLATASNDKQTTDKADTLLKLFQAGQPYIESR